MLIFRRTILSVLCVILLCVPVFASGVTVLTPEPPLPEPQSLGWALYHPGSDSFLAGERMDTPLPMASTTKIMTALLALELCDLSEKVTITGESAGVEGSSMNLRTGETYTVEELLTGLMLSSGNDAANALALHISGSETAFAELMNEKAALLKLERTHFTNPHGLPDDGHFSSAADMARLMAEAMKNDAFRALSGTKTAEIHGTEHTNHNKLLWECEGVNGGKTGYTMAAGRCLVTSCSRSGMELICVTLNDASDWADHTALYNWAYSLFVNVRLTAGESFTTIPLLGSENRRVNIVAGESCDLCLRRDEPWFVSPLIPPFAYAPVPTGEQAGSLCVASGKTRRMLPLLWGEELTEETEETGENTSTAEQAENGETAPAGQ